MGLDSVELVMSIEEKFEISIPDQECEKIVTIEQLVEAVYSRVEINSGNSSLFQTHFNLLKNSFHQLGYFQYEIKRDTIILDLISTNDIQSDWKKLGSLTGLRLPELAKRDLNPSISEEVKVLGVKLFSRRVPLTRNTMTKLTDWVISLNHEQLILASELTSKYEIERAICGIIEYNIGIPINEIELHHSFTNDLGID